MNIKETINKLINFEKDIWDMDSCDLLFYSENKNNGIGYSYIEVSMDDYNNNEYVTIYDNGENGYVPIKEIPILYPNIILDVYLAKQGIFYTWKDIEKAFNEEKEVMLLNL